MVGQVAQYGVQTKECRTTVQQALNLVETDKLFGTLNVTQGKLFNGFLHKCRPSERPTHKGCKRKNLTKC